MEGWTTIRLGQHGVVGSKIIFNHYRDVNSLNYINFPIAGLCGIADQFWFKLLFVTQRMFLIFNLRSEIWYLLRILHLKDSNILFNKQLNVLFKYI